MRAERYHIDAKKDSFDPLGDEKEKGLDAQNAKEEVQKLLDSHMGFFETLAGDTSLRFVASNEFMIDLTNGIVHLAADWFVKKGFTRAEIVWAVAHEIAHFRDLAADPKRMMENFEYIRRKAKKTAAIIEKRYEEVIGEKPQGSAEDAAHRIHHTFYNIFDDIFVNNAVARRAPRYERGTDGGKLISGLYKEKLFPGNDYTKLPRHLQFLYALLRDEMVDDEKVVVSDEVRAILEKPIKHGVRSYKPRALVENFLKPQSLSDTKAGTRYALLKIAIEPIFDGLLAKDIADWKPEKPPNKLQQMLGRGGKKDGSGSGETPFGKEYDEHEDRNPDQFKESDIEDFTEGKAEEADDPGPEIPVDADAEARAEAAQEKLDAQWCLDEGIKKEDLDKFKRLEEKIAPHLERLSALWQRIIYGSSRGINRALRTGFRTGVDLDVQKVIQNWPEIQSGHADDARVMRRIVTSENLIEQPDLIRVRVIGDVSISMDKDKMEVLRQAIALPLSSLYEFQTHLSRTRAQTKSKMRVETEVWEFEKETRLIKPRSKSGEGDRAEMVRAMAKLGTGQRKSTDDAKAFGKIHATLTEEELSSIRSKKTMDIVFLITDGGSDNAHKARQQLDKLLGAGVIVRGFQIGAVDKDERASFRDVWNKGRKRPLGEYVGSDIGSLVPAVARALAEYMQNVKL